MSIIYPTITVLGAGSYGTAIAIALSRNGHTILLWGHNVTHIQQLKTSRCNQNYLPDITFPSSLYLETSLSAAVSTCRNLLIAVPSHVFSHVVMRLKPNLKNNTRIIIASKGLEPKTGRLLQDVTHDILGKNIPIAIISGPTFAKELAMGLPTAISLASNDTRLSYDLQNILHCSKNLRIYSNTDTIGIQIAGVVKNIIAIGAGISDGIGFGSNARTALITRGLVEMSRLGIAIGAMPDTFMGLSGLGDLILTCTDNQSRNRRFGVLLGQGFNIHHAQKKIGKTIEGFCNIKEVYMLSVKYKVDMPITEQTYQILYQNKNVHDAAHSLLERTQKEEKINR
ncbi:NAD(P)H-dependent glycerol-3-phosphate dehydrogenase [Blochmannia endosymbiont of Camponotus sp. C-046]|uniref:NAD(P)H-dependent glycerol-3-phosphate dehydrogenase n=1 Tax=Blochmannia endosymbiont of Camponotus sp. C-046 TaxID=2945589 RepID=UPI002025A6DD|nr:NAD(P)H-dependent glycerol-3-phosphate dehydrogenase [Blochmannia endosymbiont of Camponotus sp. C-046]URJ28723.1 NAD(P)H-dependent glycerol-3-phosphate dehydrogenase [Blochmannia endosymbiont of Camponotus sp. C-046]